MSLYEAYLKNIEGREKIGLSPKPIDKKIVSVCYTRNNARESLELDDNKSLKFYDIFGHQKSDAGVRIPVSEEN